MADYTGNRIADLDETKPDGTVEPPKKIDDAIREIKRALKNLEIEEANDVPAKSGNAGRALVVKSDESGFEYRIFKLSELDDVDSPSGHGGEFLRVKSDESGYEYGEFFPSGTRLPFYQDTAPNGWSILTTLNDGLLYVTKGSAAGGETGGQQKPNSTWQQPGHALTINEIPGHNHSISISSAGAHSHTYTHIGSGSSFNFAGGDEENAFVTSNTSTAGSHTHSASIGSTGGGQAHNHGSSWRPFGYNCIIAEKD